MRISDWSSDVCSSDLVAECGRDRAGTAARIDGAELATRKRAEGGKGKEGAPDHATRFTSRSGTTMIFFGDAPASTPWIFSDEIASASISAFGAPLGSISSEARRVGKEFVGPCRYRWSPSH